MWNYAQHYAMSDNSWETTFGPSAPGAINLISGDTGGVDTGHEANNPSVSTSTSPNGGHHPGRQGRLLAHERRAALLGRLLDARRRRAEGQEHRRPAERAPPLLGLVRGWLCSDDDVRHGSGGARDRAPRTADGDVHPRRVQGELHRQGHAGGCLEPGALRLGPRRGRRLRGEPVEHPDQRPVRHQGRLHRAPRAIRVLRLDGQPASPGADERRRPSGGTRRATRTGCRSSTRPTTTTTRVTSTLSSRPSTITRRTRTCLRSASSRRPATRTATPPTRTRRTSRRSSSTSSTSSSSRPTGRARP